MVRIPPTNGDSAFYVGDFAFFDTPSMSKALHGVFELSHQSGKKASRIRDGLHGCQTALSQKSGVPIEEHRLCGPEGTSGLSRHDALLGRSVEAAASEICKIRWTRKKK